MSDGMEIVFRTRSKTEGRVMIGRFKSKKSKQVGKITVDEAAEIIHACPQYVRVAMQQGRLNIGSCAKVGEKRWCYNISPWKLGNYCGKDIREELKAIRERKAAGKRAKERGG